MSESAPQVLVVGAGPTGLITAIELRRRHINCRIVERRAGPVHTSRAITVHARTLEILEGMGIAERFLHGGIRNDGYEFNFLGQAEKPYLDYTKLPTRYPYVCMFNQNETEIILRDHLEHNLGLTIEWNTELTQITQSPSNTIEVTLTHKTPDGAEERIKPAWVIACDGLHSPTREMMGIRYAGSEYDGMVMQMIDVVLTNFKGTDHLLHYHISKDTFLMVGKLAGPNHRVLVSATGEIENIAEQDLITPIVKLHLPEVQIGVPEWRTAWEIWIRKAEAYRKGNVFLCGEAGHIHSVAGGQGWNVSLQDAYNLVWKLALVIRGQARPSLLDTYEREREPVADQVIEGSSAIHEIIMAHGSGIQERLALTQAEGWQEKAAARISGLSYNYKGLIEVPAGTREDFVPAVGERMPDITLSPHLRLHQLIAHPRFTLFILLRTLDTAPLALAATAAQGVLQHYSACVRVELIAPEVPHPWPSILPIADPALKVAAAFNVSSGGEFMLVRPDGYIGYRCDLNRVDLLESYLNSILIKQA